MNNKKLTPSIGILPLILLTSLVQGCHNGSTTSSNAQALSYTIPYSNTIQNPNTNILNDPTINVQLFGESLTTPLDTGSRGFFVTQNLLFPESFIPVGNPGSIFYWSSGRRFNGIWVTTNVSYSDAIDSNTGESIVPSATIPVLIVQSITCESGNWPNSCGVPMTKTTTKPTDEQTLNMGIGFDRTGYQQVPDNDQNNQQYNPFLNLDAMKAGNMRAGYILGLKSVQLGLTTSNTSGGFAFGKLAPTGYSQVPGSPPDWQPATGRVTLTLNGEVTTHPIGEAVIDIGISDMLLTLQNQPTSGQLLTGMVTVSLLGSNGTAIYTFSPTESTPQATAPSIVNWTAAQSGVFSQNQVPFSNNFVNTGRNVLNCFDYLYDAQDGYIGLRLLNGVNNCSEAKVIPAKINPLWLN
jgi:hypothetical protein